MEGMGGGGRTGAGGGGGMMGYGKTEETKEWTDENEPDERNSKKYIHKSVHKVADQRIMGDKKISYWY